MKRFLMVMLATLVPIASIARPAANAMLPMHPTFDPAARAPILPPGGNMPGGGGAGTITGNNPPTVNAPTVEFSVADCMNQLSACVNGGAVHGGINALFNRDMRNSILNGMAVCPDVVDTCVHYARRMDGQFAYRTNPRNASAERNAVWIDFNSRVIQPAYFNHVMRLNNGLTPSQAERVCLLVDRNIFGPSFAAVWQDGSLTLEQKLERTIGITRLGTQVHHHGTPGQFNFSGSPGPNEQYRGMHTPDGRQDHLGVHGPDQVFQRGYYARWDASAGQCFVRVAAYRARSEQQITVSAMGWNDNVFGNEAAQEWVAAGESFRCTGDFFGGRIMNRTATMAVVGIGGGAIVGGTIGGIAGHRANRVAGAELDRAHCDNRAFRETLADAIRSARQANPAVMEGVSIGSSESWCRRILGATTGSGDPDSEGADGLTAVQRGAVEREMEGMGNRWNVGTGIAVGAGVGAGVGALATGITHFIERRDVECRVGDGLAQVQFGRDGRVETLREFMVKWSLNLPDTPRPTGNQTVPFQDGIAWDNACRTISLFDCQHAMIRYQLSDGSEVPVYEACEVRGQVCRINCAVAISQGACSSNCPLTGNLPAVVCN